MPVVINRGGEPSKGGNTKGASAGGRATATGTPPASPQRGTAVPAQDRKRLAIVVALVMVAVLLAAFSAYRTLINPPEAGEEYRSQAAAAAGQRPRLAAEAGGQSALPSPDDEEEEAQRNQAGGPGAVQGAAPGYPSNVGQRVGPGMAGGAGGAYPGGMGAGSSLSPGDAVRPDDN